MNARQRRLFEEARKRNPELKIPEAPPTTELTDEDLALIKQGVGDKSARLGSAQAAEQGGEADSGEQTGQVVNYFEDKGFGFLRPDAGGKDVFFHISRLVEAAATDLAPGVRVQYELGMDRNGKIAASRLRLSPPQS